MWLILQGFMAPEVQHTHGSKSICMAIHITENKNKTAPRSFENGMDKPRAGDGLNAADVAASRKRRPAVQCGAMRSGGGAVQLREVDHLHALINLILRPETEKGPETLKISTIF